MRKRQNAHHRIVNAHANVAIVAQKRIGDASKLAQRFFVGNNKRIIVDISRRHNQHIASRCRAKIVQQQMMKRRLRKHNSQLRQGISQPLRKLYVRLFFQKHNGARR